MKERHSLVSVSVTSLACRQPAHWLRLSYGQLRPACMLLRRYTLSLVLPYTSALRSPIPSGPRLRTIRMASAATAAAVSLQEVFFYHSFLPAPHNSRGGRVTSILLSFPPVEYAFARPRASFLIHGDPAVSTDGGVHVAYHSNCSRPPACTCFPTLLHAHPRPFSSRAARTTRGCATWPPTRRPRPTPRTRPAARCERSRCSAGRRRQRSF